MLQRASLYKEDISNFLMDIKNENFLRFYFASSYIYATQPKESEQNEISRVSLSESGALFGLFSAGIDRDSMNVVNLGACSLCKKINPVLIKDLILFIHQLFYKHSMLKISFSISAKNPLMVSCDKALQKINGRVAGYKKSDWKLMDNEYTDVKLYEILKSDYQLSEIYNRLSAEINQIQKGVQS